MAQPAAHAVLNTVELLEAILLNIDAKTLLLSQRTCKTWQEVIASSILLQEALFFRPAPQPSSPGDATSDDANLSAANPDAANADAASSDDANGEPVSNPLARKAFQLRKLKTAQPNTKVKGQPKEYVNPWISGSFRRMYVTQPPAHEVSICTCHGGICSGDETIVPRGGEHVTIGDILDKLEKLSGGKPHKAKATVRSALVGGNRVDIWARQLPPWYMKPKVASGVYSRMWS